MDLDRGGVAMESLTHQRESPPRQAAVAGAVSSACPRLALLPPYGKRTDDFFSGVADAKTTTTSAASNTSTGRRFRVSFALVPSPAISTFCYGWEDQDPQADGRRVQCPIVLAAHGDCLLLEVTTPSTGFSPSRPPPDYFLYQASVAGRPPSLLLLPPCYIPMQHDRRGGESPPHKPRHMVRHGTGLLRRSDGDILLAQLELDIPEKEAAAAGELCLLRPGRDSEWQLKTEVPIVVDDDDNNKGSRHDRDREDEYEDDHPLRWWWTDAAFAVGDRFLCWVDYLRGFLFTDMAADESSLRLRYAPLPGVVPPSGNPEDTEGGRSNMAWTRSLGPAGDGSVRFVDVKSRCCCGDAGRTRCERGRFLFTVTTWTLKLSTEEAMEWVKDGVLDCDELWAQPGYTGLPRITVEYPIVVNSDDPDAVCFVVGTDYRWYSMDDSVDKKVWTIEVDTRRKMLHSVIPYNGSDIPTYCSFPAKIQY